MSFLITYFALGLVAYLWLFFKTSKGVTLSCLLFSGSDIGLIFCAVLWPIMVPFCLIDNGIQEKEMAARENRKEPVKEDLGALEGKLGEALTPQAPSGKISVDGKEYESRSVGAFIPKGDRIRVVGHSMNYLAIEPAELSND